MMHHLQEITDENAQLRSEMETLIKLKQLAEPRAKDQQQRTKRQETITKLPEKPLQVDESHVPYYIPLAEFRAKYEDQLAA